jgi:hypothetical protein
MGSFIIFVHHYERRKGTPDNVALLEQLREEPAGVKKIYPEATGKYIAMQWKGRQIKIWLQYETQLRRATRQAAEGNEKERAEAKFNHASCSDCVKRILLYSVDEPVRDYLGVTTVRVEATMPWAVAVM